MMSQPQVQRWPPVPHRSSRRGPVPYGRWCWHARRIKNTFDTWTCIDGKIGRNPVHMNREMEHIDMLAGTIGFRVATTEGERRAGRYIEQELAHYGLHDVRQ